MHLKRVRQVPVAPALVLQLSASVLRRRACRHMPASPSAGAEGDVSV